MRAHGAFKKKGNGSEIKEPKRTEELLAHRKKGRATLSQAIEFIDQLRTPAARLEVLTVFLGSMSQFMGTANGEKMLVKQMMAGASVIRQFLSEITALKENPVELMKKTSKSAVLDMFEGALPSA
ncbi:MAG: hypothetical protein WC813_03995 [Patescibacteria group bacterium]